METKEFLQLVKNFENQDLEYRIALSEEDDKDRIAKTVTAFYNTHGGKIIFGVEDKKRRLVGLRAPQRLEHGLTNKIRARCKLDVSPQIEFVEYRSKSFIIVHCPKGPHAPYYVKGYPKPFVRRGSSNFEANDIEIAQMYRDSSGISYDRTIVNDASLEDIDLKAAKRYISKRKKSKEIAKEALLDILRKEGILCRTRDGEYLPTIAGLLLFGKDPQSCLPHTAIKADAKYRGSDKDWDAIATFEGNLFQQIKQFDEFITPHIRVSAKIVGFKRIEKTEFPIEALREAFINALAHRDYGFIQGSIAVRISDNSIEIASPGELLRPLTIDDLKREEFEPVTRNKVIVKALVEEELMEERGTGFIRMKKLAKEYDLERFDFKEYMGFFKVTFQSKPLWGKEIEKKKILIPDETLKALDNDQLKILEVLEEKEKVKVVDCVSQIKKSPITIRRKLKNMVEKKILEVVGKSPTDPTTYYILHPRFTNRK